MWGKLAGVLKIMTKQKFLKHMILFAFIPLVLSIGMAPAMSFGNIFGSPKKQMDDGVARCAVQIWTRPNASSIRICCMC